MNASFFAFVPLSNWIRGFDRYRQVFDKRALLRARFQDVFYVLPSSASEVQVREVLEKTRALVQRLGVPGDTVIRLEARLPASLDEKLQDQVAFPNVFTGTEMGWRWPSPALPLTGYGFIGDSGELLPATHEVITARAFALPNPDLYGWHQCAPRSFSVLPVARACNASCQFCFSKASISASVAPDHVDLKEVEYWAALARRRGAGRAVITGGGEPTLLREPQMQGLVEILGRYYEHVLMITNGSMLERWHEKDGPYQLQERLKRWRGAGLTRIALSRHGSNLEEDAQIMGLRVNTAVVARALCEADVPTRLICVMQKNGVDSPEAIERYLRRAVRDGIEEICFKELYVSSLSENPWAPSAENLYCQKNQVPLSLLVKTLGDLGLVQTGQLPWGSPVYQGLIDGQPLRVAAYTEPSVGWERRHGIARSWNFMANGECMASLEDPASRLTDTR